MHVARIGPLPRALWCVMYFRFCGWRHVSTSWPHGVVCIRITATEHDKHTAGIPTRFFWTIKTGSTNREGVKSGLQDCVVLMLCRRCCRVPSHRNRATRQCGWGNCATRSRRVRSTGGRCRPVWGGKVPRSSSVKTPAPERRRRLPQRSTASKTTTNRPFWVFWRYVAIVALVVVLWRPALSASSSASASVTALRWEPVNIHV